ncbi:hypothetical protein [Hyphomonas sp.]|uniref:hypothetical protein n=1 Tax=Hyphomonas sp. TaxID=87 RepID=UPI00391D4A14
MAKDTLDKLESRWSLGDMLWKVLPVTVTGAVGSAMIALTDALNAYAPASYFFGFLLGALGWLAALSVYESRQLSSDKRSRFRDLAAPKSTFNPLDTTFEKKRIFVADLPVPGINVIEGKNFIGCQLIGPAVVYFETGNINGNSFYGCDNLVITNPDARIYNVIVLRDCTVKDCDLIELTLYWSEPAAKLFEKGVSGGKIDWLSSPSNP